MSEDTTDAEVTDGGVSRGGQRVRIRHFSRSLPMLLLRGRESVMQHFRASLRSHDITEQQWRILRTLTSVDDIEATDLAYATFLLAPSLSRILRDLEARDLIKRTPDPKDLRIARISISPKGAEFIDEVAPQSELIYSKITEALGVDRLKHLQELLEVLETTMNGLVIEDEGLSPTEG
jgi:homoprotocatechuate degradation regulator HpaR